MKKLFALALTALLTVSVIFSAAAENDSVEIAFRVGDSILKINGEDVEVEKPYIAGDGTTLVPIRVISEAFGANVGWDGETKTVTVVYGEKNITLQIDNKTAIVNGIKEELLEAPQITENGYTMIPLRFISETLGAVVGYDAETQAITVSKAAAEVPTETPLPAATLNPDAQKLSDDDIETVKAEYGTVRYNFEQSVLPAYIFSEDVPAITDTEKFTDIICYAWLDVTDYCIANVLTETENVYIIESEDDLFGLLDNAAIQCSLTIEENIEDIDYLDGNDGDILAVITMKDCDKMLISKYIGIKYNEKTGYRVFTLEKSFGDSYMFCEIMRDGRGSIHTLPCDYNAFIEAVKTV